MWWMQIVCSLTALSGCVWWEWQTPPAVSVCFLLPSLVILTQVRLNGIYLFYVFIYPSIIRIVFSVKYKPTVFCHMAFVLK